MQSTPDVRSARAGRPHRPTRDAEKLSIPAVMRKLEHEGICVPRISDEAWARADERARELREREAAKAKGKQLRERVDRAALADVPKLFLQRILRGELQDRPSLRDVHAFEVSGQRSLVLCGLHNSGKSQAAGVWLWRRLAPRGTTAAWLTAPRVGRLSGFGSKDYDSGAFEKGEFDTLMRAPFMVLDDLGGEDDPHGRVAKRIEEIIDFRYSNDLPLVITSNQSSPTSFSRQYGKYRTYRRLLENGMVKWTKGGDEVPAALRDDAEGAS